jgi:hypothetical protein
MGKGLGSAAPWSLACIQTRGTHIKIVITETAKEYLNFKTEWYKLRNVWFSNHFSLNLTPNYVIASL